MNYFYKRQLEILLEKIRRRKQSLQIFLPPYKLKDKTIEDVYNDDDNLHKLYEEADRMVGKSYSHLTG